MTFSRAELAATALALAAVVAAQTAVLFVRPPGDPPGPVETLVLLVPSPQLQAAATELMEDGAGQVLVIIRQSARAADPFWLCDREQAFEVRCPVQPRADGTRGQVRFAAELLADAGGSAAVVVPHYKVVRVRLLLGRCTEGSPVGVHAVRVEGAPLRPPREWPALLAALAFPGC